MILAVLTIVFSIISFFQPWFFIGSIVCLVLAVGEYIFEVLQADLFDNAALVITSVILGIAALALGIISLICGLNSINNASEPAANLLLNLF